MNKYQGFIDTFLCEANYAGVSLVALDVVDGGRGVFSLIAKFKDGGTSRVNRRADIFAGDGFVQRQELLQNIVAVKVEAPKAEMEFVAIDEAAEIPDEVVKELAPSKEEAKDVDSEKEEENEDKPTLAEALAKLNHKDDAHWTQAGLPNLNVLKEYAGRAVTRKEVNEEFSEFVRKDEA